MFDVDHTAPLYSVKSAPFPYPTCPPVVAVDAVSTRIAGLGTTHVLLMTQTAVAVRLSQFRTVSLLLLAYDY